MQPTLVFVALFAAAVTAAPAAHKGSSKHDVKCTPVKGYTGHLVLSDPKNGTNKVTLGLGPVGIDKHPLLQDAQGKPVEFTFEGCTSKYMGFKAHEDVDLINSWNG